MRGGQHSDPPMAHAEVSTATRPNGAVLFREAAQSGWFCVTSGTKTSLSSKHASQGSAK